MKKLGKILAISGLLTLVPISIRGKDISDIYNYPKKIQQQIQNSPLENYHGKSTWYTVEKRESPSSLAVKSYNEPVMAYAIADWNKEFDLTSYDNKGNLISNFKEGDIVMLKNVTPLRVKKGETYASVAKEQGITETEARIKFSWNEEELKEGDVIYKEKDVSKKENFEHIYD